MMDGVQFWILSGIATLLFLIVSYMLKTTITEILAKLQMIIVELKELSKLSTAQEERIKYMHEIQVDIITRLKIHDERLYRLEYHEKSN